MRSTKQHNSFLTQTAVGESAVICGRLENTEDFAQFTWDGTGGTQLPGNEPTTNSRRILQGTILK